MSGQKLYTFPIHPMMFSWSPAAADSSAGVAHQGQCQREFGILWCSFILNKCLCCYVREEFYAWLSKGMPNTYYTLTLNYITLNYSLYIRRVLGSGAVYLDTSRK